MNTQHDITVSGKPLNPPKPPAKPHMLLWIDTETTGISRTNAKLLEIGMIVTSLDGTEEGDRFICPVRPDCAQRFNDQTIGTIHIRRDHRDKLSPYLLEYQSTDLKEDQA